MIRLFCNRMPAVGVLGVVWSNTVMAPPFGEHRKLRFPVRKVFFTGSRERNLETSFLPK